MPSKKQKPGFRTNLRNRYELASHSIFNKLPAWKQSAIKIDRQTGNFNSHVMNEYAKQVENLVNDNTEIFLT